MNRGSLSHPLKLQSEMTSNNPLDPREGEADDETPDSLLFGEPRPILPLPNEESDEAPDDSPHSLNPGGGAEPDFS